MRGIGMTDYHVRSILVYLDSRLFVGLPRQSNNQRHLVPLARFVFNTRENGNIAYESIVFEHYQDSFVTGLAISHGCHE